jgi:hypothetical protein
MPRAQKRNMNRRPNRMLRRPRVKNNYNEYKRINVGFEQTFQVEFNSPGMVVPISPDAYLPTALPSYTTACSAYFGDRFVRTFRSWRMLGWKATVIAGDSTAGQNAVLGVAPFNLSKQVTTPVVPGVTVRTPGSMAFLCELPNVKMLDCSAENNRNRASFSYFSKRTDINLMPFQEIAPSDNIEQGKQLNLPSLYFTGLQMFLQIDSPPPLNGGIITRVFGTMMIEFKDFQPFAPPSPIDLDMEYLRVGSPKPQAKRLQR